MIKAHPLDVGFEHWTRVVPRLARAAGIETRVDFADGGGLNELLDGASGMVTVNSSAGLEVLRAGFPVKTLCPAIFDVVGITNRQSLDVFWTNPTPPDPALVEAFVTALAGSVQARGTIHNRAGFDEAVATMSAWILENWLNKHGAFVDPPPRGSPVPENKTPLFEGP